MSDDPKIMMEHYTELKREQILAMEPGRELNQQIDVTMFGMEFKDFPYGRKCYRNGGWRSARPYSTDISTALVAEAKAIEQNNKGYVMELVDILGLSKHDIGTEFLTRLLKATPEQRCKAALLAVMGL